MTILDNYMFRPLLVIFRLSSRELKILLYIYIYIYIYIYTHTYKYTVLYTECPRRNVPDFGRVFLVLKYTDITQNTYVKSWTVTEIMAREVWNFDSCYTLTDYHTFKTYYVTFTLVLTGFFIYHLQAPPWGWPQVWPCYAYYVNSIRYF